MKKRNPIAVAVFTVITASIYGIYWLVKTKGELNAKGAKIPSAWMLVLAIIPFLGVIAWAYWLWKYTEAVDEISEGKISGILSFVLLFLIFFVGAAVVQDGFNKLGEPATPTPPAPADTSTLAETPAPEQSENKPTGPEA